MVKKVVLKAKKKTPRKKKFKISSASSLKKNKRIKKRPASKKIIKKKAAIKSKPKKKPKKPLKKKLGKLNRIKKTARTIPIKVVKKPTLKIKKNVVKEASIALKAVSKVVSRAILEAKKNRNIEPVSLVSAEPEALSFPTPKPVFFELPKQIESFDASSDQSSSQIASPMNQITEFDLHLLCEGNHFQSYEKLGAHQVTENGRNGFRFAVWAPHARSVSVIGDFNDWKAGSHLMERLSDTGYWSLFVPDISEGDLYKFAIEGSDGCVREKADPYAFAAELRPATASVVTSLSKYEWHDHSWMQERVQKKLKSKPFSIYEVHLGSWKRGGENGTNFLNYRELAHDLVSYVQSMGYTHIELMPIMEHPFDDSWGYQITGYFAPTRRFGTPQDFMYFVDYCHQNGIGVILDWVPGHFPKDEFGLSWFDGQALYEYGDPRKAEHKEWGTLVFDYGSPQVQNFLISSALFWLEKYHVDAIRVDAVASMLYLDYGRSYYEWAPNEMGSNQNFEAVHFIKRMNDIIRERVPGVLTIAEESTAWKGVSHPTSEDGLGFDLKWNMGWMHDSLDYYVQNPVFRKHHHHLLTFPLVYAFNENFVLPVSHDEVVYGKRNLVSKMPGDAWQRYANTRLYLGSMMGYPGKKLLFMGIDFGQEAEWNSKQSLDWHLLEGDPIHGKLQLYVQDLNRLYRSSPALYENDFSPSGFEWMDCGDVNGSVISFFRWSNDKSQAMFVVCNHTPEVQKHYRIGVSRAGTYHQVLNSDDPRYGGSGVGYDHVHLKTQDISCHSKSQSLELTLPPLATLMFRWQAE